MATINKTTPDRLLTISEVAEFLKVNRWQIGKWLRDGKIKGHKLGADLDSKQRWRIWYSDVIAFVNQDNKRMEAKIK